jgi:hypothetical protein
MSAISCTQCGRLLKLPQELRGARVQCPLCRTAFQAPREEARPAWRPPPPPALPALPPAERRPPRLAGPPSAGELSAPGREAALASAARWLKVTLLLQGLSGLCCCVVPLPLALKAPLQADMVAWLLFCKYCPLFFGGLTAGWLRTHRGYHLCYTGGILTLATSAWTVLEMAYLGLYALANAAPQRHGQEIALLGSLLALVAAGCGFIGGIKTLTVLSDPQVRQAFR